MDALLRDLRYGARALLRRPWLSGLAALSLGLGIGANTAIFSIVNALFLRGLPVHDAATLVTLNTVDKKNPGMNPMSHLNWKDVREQNDVFSQVAGYDWVPLSVSTGGEANVLFGQMVSGNYFKTLGIKPAAGRLLSDEDDVPGGHPVAVLSYSFWERRLGRRSDVVGAKLLVNSLPFTIVGVSAAGFTGVTIGVQPELWVPMGMNRQIRPNLNWYEERRGLFLFPLARLKPGVTLSQAQAAITTIAQRLEKDFPDDNKDRSISLLPFAQSTLFPGLRGAAMAGTGMLMVVVGLVLLIACANVANLLLARATTRRREVAVRLALGAGRTALVRQLLCESGLLALAGAALGLLFAFWASHAILGFLPNLPFPVTLTLNLDLDGRVLAFTLVIALLTGLLSGLAPAIQMARPELVNALRERSSAEVRGGARLLTGRNLLVGAQVALSLVALIGAGLFVRSLGAAQKTDPGFDTDHLGLVSFDIGLQGYDEERGLQFIREARERVAALPGVAKATVASAGPLSGSLARSVFPEGQEGERGVLIQVNAVGADYFDTLRVPIVRGRALAETDTKGSVPVVVVNETMAKKFWPGKDPLGKRFRFFGEDQMVEVVGVARDAKYNSLGEDPQYYIYRPLPQDYSSNVTVVARAERDPAQILLPIQREILSLQRQLPLVGLSTVDQVIHNSLWASRLGASLLAAFGVLALLLGSVGIYGVMSYAVSRRSQEIGIRMTLGADRRQVMKMVLLQGMTVVLAGLVLGLLAAYGLTRFVASLLFVSPADPLVFGGMVVVLAAVGAVANLFPALRATAVDPLVALRSE
jgi:putative ABC transport system permease protein